MHELGTLRSAFLWPSFPIFHILSICPTYLLIAYLSYWATSFFDLYIMTLSTSFQLYQQSTSVLFWIFFCSGVLESMMWRVRVRGSTILSRQCKLRIQQGSNDADVDNNVPARRVPHVHPHRCSILVTDPACINRFRRHHHRDRLAGPCCLHAFHASQNHPRAGGPLLFVLCH